MTKERHNTKEVKKQPLKTPKEKRAAKKAKKDSKDTIQPMLRH